MAVYIKTKMTAVPSTCSSCQYREHHLRKHFDGTFETDNMCQAVRPHLSLNRIEVQHERAPKCPLREHGGSEDFEGLHFVNPYTTRLIKSMKDLEKFAERFYKAQQSAEAEE